MDVLSDVLRAVRLTGAVYFDIDAGSPWVGKSPGTAEIAAAIMPGVEHVVSFHAIISGSCWASLGDGSGSPLRVNAGDVVVFPVSAECHGDPRPNCAANRIWRCTTARSTPICPSHSSTAVEAMNGLDSSAAISAVMRARSILCFGAACPDVRAQTGRRQRLGDRSASPRPGRRRQQAAGTESILAKLSELMFVEVIRRHIKNLPEGTRGWLSGLRDPHIGMALRLIHARPPNNGHWTGWPRRLACPAPSLPAALRLCRSVPHAVRRALASSACKPLARASGVTSHPLSL